MNSEYIVHRDTIIEALIHLDDFKSKMDSFIEEHPNYNYEEELVEADGGWEIKIKVNKDEQINTEAT